MLSISWISLPRETLTRMAAQESAAPPCGRRWERVTALTVLTLVTMLAAATVVLML